MKLLLIQVANMHRTWLHGEGKKQAPRAPWFPMQYTVEMLLSLTLPTCSLFVWLITH
jgi:hypothetical protein